MDKYTATELAFKNGYEKGYEAAKAKWIPVSERLPEHFGVFIVAIREPFKERVGKDCADFDPFAKTWLPSMCWDKGYEITHWMPLPEPPKEEPPKINKQTLDALNKMGKAVHGGNDG